MREKNRNSIASIEKFPQFTTMNVIDGQAGQIICASLIFYSLTIDNILNIIVLLILAGISIAMLTGNNGILQKATDAKIETEKGQEKEIIALAYNSALTKKMGNGDSAPVTSEDMNTELTNEGANASGSNPIKVTFTESKRQYTINNNGTIEYAGISNGEQDPTELTIALTITNTPQTIQIGENIGSVTSENIPLPTGFYAVAETRKSTGFVISSVVNDDLDNTKGGDQFVWVPVDQNQKLSLTVNSPDNITEIKLYDPVGAELSLGTVSGKTYENANINPTYNGVYKAEVTTFSGTETETLLVRSLYAADAFNDFWSTNEGINILKTQMNITENSALFESLASYTGKTITNEYEFGIAYASLMANQFSDSETNYANSVNTNGGFYVARFEAGVTTKRTSGNTSSTASDIQTASGLPLSQKNKEPYTYVTRSQASGLADNMYSGKSHLLTGAAWDRTLGWLINRNNKTLSQVVADSKEWGNYQNDTFSNTTGFIKTGEFNQTKALNIYDLAGNVDEWTSENSYDSSAPCVCRGGFNGNTGDYEPADVRVQWMDSPRDNFGFRVALFL